MLLRSALPILLLCALPVAAPTQKTSTTEAKKLPSFPTEVALVEEGERGSVYRRFPTGERLYTYDRDRSGTSACDTGCAMAWPPVPAPANAEPVGEWSVVVRGDGSRQWALKGKPVYTRFHDTPEQPSADGLYGTWHLVPYTAAPANPPPVTTAVQH